MTTRRTYGLRRRSTLTDRSNNEDSNGNWTSRLRRRAQSIIDCDSYDSDGSDIIYIRPKSPPLIDLTSSTEPKTPTKEDTSRTTDKTKLLTPTVMLRQLNLHCSTITPPKRGKHDGVTPQSPRITKKRNLIASEDSDYDTTDSAARQTPQKLNDRATCYVSPSKQKKYDTCEIENVPANTPSNRAEHPKYNTPVTAEKIRRELFKDKDVYISARRALHSSCPTDMPGRDKELTELRTFILEHLNKGTSGSLYVSGPPGTGKTASLNMIVQEQEIAKQLTQVHINCTSIKSSSSVFYRLSTELGIKAKGNKEKDYVAAVEKYLCKDHKMILLVLDEIDQLESKNQSVLYTIFEWPSIRNSKLILIGIANALDLTDRTLPRLQARCELQPKLMHFAPYTKQQIVEIFTSRLRSAGVSEIFAPAAMQLLAGKVAAVSGDVRRALDIGRRVVELIDRKKKEVVLKPLENLAEELVDKELTKPKPVDLKQVVDVLNNVYGTTQNFVQAMDDAFPLQQKLVICSLILMVKKAKNKDVTVGRLYEVYRKVCNKRNIQLMDQGEFVGICSLIETKGIMKVLRKKDPRMSKISLEWNEEEVADVLKDKQLMATIIEDESCLGKM